MLGRKNYETKEFDRGKTVIDHQLAAHRKLISALGGTPDKKVASALEQFDTQLFNNMILVLDRLFVHRFSGPDHEGKDGNTLNEVRIICDSLISHDGVMRADKQIKLPPEKSVAGIGVGDHIQLDEATFKRLSNAFFEELERRFL